jgi:hypothetical protein
MIRNQKDFGAGILYIAFGAVGWSSRVITGWARHRAWVPGYFPTVLSFMLMAFGVAAVIRSFVGKEGEKVGAFNWKGVGYICGATALFGFLLTTAGLIIALVALSLVSAAASHYFKFEWKAVGALILLVVFCALVFAKGLGVPMPLIGTWFGG